MFKKYFFLTFLLIFCQGISAQPTISGKIEIDTSVWKPMIYLSLIEDFNSLYSMTNESIIDQAKLSSSGEFRIKLDFLPEGDMLYRIHFARKKDPPSSLIIGGEDENHFFIIANKNSDIIITDTCRRQLIKGLLVKGYSANDRMHDVNEIASYLDSMEFSGSVLKAGLIRNAIFEKLRQFADTCSNPLVSLYAIYKTNFEQNYLTNQQFYKEFLIKWKKEQSPYFIQFRKQIPISHFNNRAIFIITGFIIFLIGFSTSWILSRLVRRPKNSISDLSVQQRKIYALLMEGKSNKEISEILNIGANTVKSHINKIYSKLEINSRKEILNLNLDD